MRSSDFGESTFHEGTKYHRFRIVTSRVTTYHSLVDAGHPGVANIVELLSRELVKASQTNRHTTQFNTSLDENSSSPTKAMPSFSMLIESNYFFMKKNSPESDDDRNRQVFFRAWLLWRLFEGTGFLVFVRLALSVGTSLLKGHYF